ncbi:2TM domain-containing protein [Seonamhaeicola algicola]|uniref:2TM domain-containing protein n=1 Tax=Seonamhaeicola algicola TaxID=1719036 RepID=A0A5C7ANS6_9FLAO|nr:2TM domain-containing protein [Seonamhaeicola algicola]TXE09991.1 2TM domain-containing protein [Seonamhaeicola algicola]
MEQLKDFNTDYKKEDAYLRAQKRVKDLKGFYAHALWYLVINIILIVLIGANSNGNIWNFGTFATAFFWGIGLAFHALGVFGKNIFFSKNWEERKIQEYMRKEETEKYE